MKFKDDITYDFAEAIISYNPDTGDFFWKPRDASFFKRKGTCEVWNRRYANKAAGYISNDGYLILSINKKRYQAHRVAWLLVNKKWPSISIDHINCIKFDNRISNLREAQICQNAWNTSIPSNNKSGFKGVYYHKAARKWCAMMNVENKRFYLGLYMSAEEAYEAYKKAARQYHGEYARI